MLLREPLLLRPQICPHYQSYVYTTSPSSRLSTTFKPIALSPSLPISQSDFTRCNGCLSPCSVHNAETHRRISISVVASNVPLATDFLPMDVFPDMTLNDLKALVEDEIKVPPVSQTYYLNNQPLLDPSKTLTELNVTESDMLGLAVQNADQTLRRRTQQDPGPQQRQRTRAGPDPERLRLHLIGDTRVMEEVRGQDPELAEAANDRDKFHSIWDQRQRQLAATQAEKDEQISMLNADPFNADAQAKIEEMIRQERVHENVEKALQENPESFAAVTMLYIDVLVNNVPIKAFVDSGAQTTIMSPDAAERCGIRRLIDARFGGIARGVGTAKILGRVHHAELQIGQYNLASSFTVMEGKDVDLLLGLDMLKRHQMCIDLRSNCLMVQDDRIPFLAENEIPKMMQEILEKEPKVSGPQGTTIGATTGTVEHAESSSPSSIQAKAPPSSRIKIHPAGSSGNISTKAQASPTQSSAPSGQTQPSTSAFGQPQSITAESIRQVTDLGFTREEAIHALEQVGGNVELAIGILL